jgi:predicted negative regulator of RcsB-dependent stress response
VEIYQTEEQQVEAIKSFWQTNGNAIIAGVLLGLGGFASYGYYMDYKMEQEIAAADAYLTNVEKNAKDGEQFNKVGEQYVAEHQNSSYATLTALAMAKNAAQQQDWPQAATHLTNAVASAPNAGMKAIALLRLARVQLQQQQYTEALATLATPMPAAYNASIEEVKGDLYMLQNNKDLAVAAYQAAIDAGGLTTNPALQMKVDDLAVSLN